MRLSDLIEEFLIDCRARRLAPKTLRAYTASLRYFRDWLADEGAPDALTSFTLAQARRYSQTLSQRTAKKPTFVSDGGPRGVHALAATERPLTANSLIAYLRVLKTLSRWLAAEEQGYLGRDVLAGLRLPGRPKTRQEPLTTEEMGQVVAGYDLRNPTGIRDFAIILTYLGTGLRATELTMLEVADVRLEEGYLRVRTGKGNKTRAVNLPPEVARAILRYRQHYRPKSASSQLFLTRSGRAMTYNTVKLLIARAKRRSGIARLHAHLLRHSFGVTALTNGMDLMTLKETLGHEDIQTTSIYLDMSEQQLIAQQRKVNPLERVRLPKAIRIKEPA